MKIYKAIEENDNLIFGKEYVGYDLDIDDCVGSKSIQLTHVVSSDRVIQLTNPIITSYINLTEIGDNANIGLNHNAKAIKRVRGNK
jgi:hypothetical protein